MFSPAQRFNRSCSIARHLIEATGVNRVVLTPKMRPGTFVVATNQELAELFNGNRDQILWQGDRDIRLRRH